MSADARRAAVRVVIAGLVCWAAAALVYGTLRVTFGPRPVYVHVRWAPAVDEAARQRLEQQYQLSEGALLEGRTFGYTLLDASRPNIRTLVEDPSVEDTHYIHRTAFRPWRTAPRRPYATTTGWMPVALETLVALLFLAGAIRIGYAAVHAVVLRRPPEDAIDLERRAAAAFAGWLRTRIPPASAEAAALFRIVFVSALLLLVLREPVLAEWASEPSNAVSEAHRTLLQIFVAAPWLARVILPWVAVWGALVIAGAFTRTAYAMLVPGVFAWVLLFTTRTTYHTVTALQLALICLLWAKWGDAWSVDARRGQRIGSPLEYGYTVWVPGLVIGVAFAAAAVAKIRDSGLAWILNGTVKYHFLSDAGQALTDWGRLIGPHHTLAVLLSLGAIVIESVVIFAVFSRRYAYRLVAGLASMSLLAGFALLQGLIWPGWWMLLLSFLPWHLVRPAAGRAAAPVDETAESRPSRRHAFQPAALAVVLALIAQQIVVSALRLEVSPLISKYDMYSTTYQSPAEYEQKAGEEYWIVSADAGAAPHECRISRVDVDMLGQASAGQGDRARAMNLLRRCFTAEERFANLSVESRRARVDWQEWRLEEPAKTELFPIAVGQ